MSSLTLQLPSFLLSVTGHAAMLHGCGQTWAGGAGQAQGQRSSSLGWTSNQIGPALPTGTDHFTVPLLKEAHKHTHTYTQLQHPRAQGRCSLVKVMRMAGAETASIESLASIGVATKGLRHTSAVCRVLCGALDGPAALTRNL